MTMKSILWKLIFHEYKRMFWESMLTHSMVYGRSHGYHLQLFSEILQHRRLYCVKWVNVHQNQWHRCNALGHRVITCLLAVNAKEKGRNLWNVAKRSSGSLSNLKDKNSKYAMIIYFYDNIITYTTHRHKWRHRLPLALHCLRSPDLVMKRTHKNH
jgi:hypothetical protein